MAPLNPKKYPTEFYTPKTFFTLNGAAAAVWFLCLMLGAIFPPNSITPLQYRLVAVLFSELIAIMMVYNSENKKPLYWFLAFFNGLLIFVNASGWNVVTSNSFFSDKPTTSYPRKKKPVTASILNLNQIQWWDNNLLFISNKRLVRQYDSLTKVNTVYKNIINENRLYVTREVITRKDFIIDSLNKTIVKHDSIVVERVQPSSFFASAIFIEKMNLLYYNIENPVSVSSPNIKEKINIRLGGGLVIQLAPTRFILIPNRMGPDTITASYKGDSTTFLVRVKRLPDPTATVGGSKGGKISSAVLKAQGGVIAKLLESEYNASFRVISYTVGANGGPISIYRQAYNTGARWQGEAARIIDQCGPGTALFFDDIMAKGEDGTVRNLGTIAFQLK